MSLGLEFSSARRASLRYARPFPAFHRLVPPALTTASSARTCSRACSLSLRPCFASAHPFTHSVSLRNRAPAAFLSPIATRAPASCVFVLRRQLAKRTCFVTLLRPPHPPHPHAHAICTHVRARPSVVLAAPVAGTKHNTACADHHHRTTHGNDFFPVDNSVCACARVHSCPLLPTPRARRRRLRAEGVGVGGRNGRSQVCVHVCVVVAPARRRIDRTHCAPVFSSPRRPTHPSIPRTARAVCVCLSLSPSLCVPRYVCVRCFGLCVCVCVCVFLASRVCVSLFVRPPWWTS